MTVQIGEVESRSRPGGGAAGVFAVPPRQTNSFAPAVEAAVRRSTAPELWRTLLPERGQVWLRLLHRGEQVPEQGWKLHLSANTHSAASILARAVPRLLEERASFKLAASPELLRRLNRGEFGMSQIGKFITVYPATDDEAVRIADALHEATLGLRGPDVPTDRRLRPESLVSYRYGGFTGLCLRRPTGEALPALRAPDGELVPDERSVPYCAPAWAVDPFGGEAVAEPPGPGTLIDGRLLVVAALASAPRGQTILAADLVSGERRVLKGVRRAACIDAGGGDAGDLLRREALLLTRAGATGVPALQGLIEQGEMLWLEMEDVAGRTFDQFMAERGAECRLPGDHEVVRLGLAMAAAVERLHLAGIAHRDIRSSNLIVTPGGQTRLIDLGSAHALDDDGRRGPVGSRGYRSGAGSAVEEDVYGLGALLYFMTTGAEPGVAPKEFNLLERPVELMNANTGSALAAVVSRCLAPPGDRYPSMADVRRALASVPAHPGAASSDRAAPALDYRDMAMRLAGALCVDSAQRPLAASERDEAIGVDLDLATGAGGSLLALSEIVAELDCEEHRTSLDEQARHLASSVDRRGRLPGLFAGEAGMATALLRAGQVLGDDRLVEAASRRSAWVALQPHDSPDIYVGTAGRLRFHLLLWDQTGEPGALAAAVAAGEALLRVGEAVAADGIRWRIPPGYGTMSGQCQLGYAHGAAGIADALLDLFEATGREEYFQTAAGAARWVLDQARPTLHDRSGLGWPLAAGGPLHAAMWCHGAGGIGQFFLHAAKHDLIPDALAVAGRAAASVAVTRWISPCQCHGLAGSIEFLLDLFQATGLPAYLAQAQEIGHVLQAFAFEEDGQLLWQSDVPHGCAPAYLTGCAGIAPCLLRLAEPETLPRQLSRAGFRRRLRGSV